MYEALSFRTCCRLNASHALGEDTYIAALSGTRLTTVGLRTHTCCRLDASHALGEDTYVAALSGTRLTTVRYASGKSGTASGTRLTTSA